MHCVTTHDEKSAMIYDAEEAADWFERDCRPSSTQPLATSIGLQPRKQAQRHAPPSPGDASLQPTSDMGLETQHRPDAQVLARNIPYEFDFEIQQIIDAQTSFEWLHGFDFDLLPNPTTGPMTNEASPPSRSSSTIYCWDHGCRGREFSCSSNYRRHCREKSDFCEKAACPFCRHRFSRALARDVHLRKGRCKKAPVSARVEPSMVTSPSLSTCAQDHTEVLIDTSTSSSLERLGTLGNDFCRSRNGEAG